MSYNVLYGFNRSKQEDAAVKWIASQSLDFLTLQEMHKFTPERLTNIAKRWGHQYSYLFKRSKSQPLAFLLGFLFMTLKYSRRVLIVVFYYWKEVVTILL